VAGALEKSVVQAWKKSGRLPRPKPKDSIVDLSKSMGGTGHEPVGQMDVNRQAMCGGGAADYPNLQLCADGRLLRHTHVLNYLVSTKVPR
jgi:hypothetical protein